MVVFEGFGDCGVHFAELAAVAFVEDENEVLCEYGVGFVSADEDGEFLDGGDDDSGGYTRFICG